MNKFEWAAKKIYFSAEGQIQQQQFFKIRHRSLNNLLAKKYRRIYSSFSNLFIKLIRQNMSRVEKMEEELIVLEEEVLKTTSNICL